METGWRRLGKLLKAIVESLGPEVRGGDILFSSGKTRLSLPALKPCRKPNLEFPRDEDVLPAATQPYLYFWTGGLR